MPATLSNAQSNSNDQSNSTSVHYKFQGTAYDSVTSRTVNNANLTVTSETDNNFKPITFKPDSKGVFIIKDSDLPDGVYDLSFSAPRYYSYSVPEPLYTTSDSKGNFPLRPLDKSSPQISKGSTNAGSSISTNAGSSISTNAGSSISTNAGSSVSTNAGSLVSTNAGSSGPTYTGSSGLIQNGLQFYYDGSSISGSTVNDLSGNGHNGAIVGGGITAHSYPLGNQYMTFDGNSKISIAHADWMNVADAFTYEVQYNSSNVKKGQFLFGSSEDNFAWTPGGTSTNSFTVPRADPSDITKFNANNAGSVLSIDTTQPRIYGDHSLKVVCDGKYPYQGFNVWAVAPASKNYIGSVYLSGSGTVELSMNEISSGTIVHTYYCPTSTITLTSTPTKYYVTGNFDSVATHASLNVITKTKQSATIYASGLQLMQNSFSYYAQFDPTSTNNVLFYVNTTSGIQSASASSDFRPGINTLDFIYNRYASDGKRLKIIVNRYESGYSNGLNAGLYPNNNKIVIGEFYNVNLNTDMSYIRMYNRALSFSEYIQNYANDLGRSAPRKGGIAITFDDANVTEWTWLDQTLLHPNGFKATYFCSNVGNYNQDQINNLVLLNSEGNDIGAHSWNHKDPQLYFSDPTKYLNEQIIPEITLMSSWGLKPSYFAYPFGNHNAALDNALLNNTFSALRTTKDTYPDPYYKFDNNRFDNNRIVGGASPSSSDITSDGFYQTMDTACLNGWAVVTISHCPVADTVPSDAYNTNISVFRQIVNYSNSLGITSYAFRDLWPQSNSSPVAAFSATPTSGNAPLTVQFTDQSTNSPTSWQWNFGDGNYSSVTNPVHTFNTPGNYTVTLTVGNAAGNNTLTKTNYITSGSPKSNQYGTGGPNSIAMDNAGHCIEVHVDSGKLFYKVGNVDVNTGAITWSQSIQYDVGSSNSISMDNAGHCIEVHVSSGNLFYKVGNVNFNSGTITWSQSQSAQYGVGSFNSISMDNTGHCVEVHVDSGNLVYKVGNVDFNTGTITWK